MRRPDAERDEPAVLRECRRTRGIGDERIDVADQVIGRQDQKRRIGADAIGRIERGKQHRRRRVAAGGLEQERQLVEIGGRMVRVFVARQEVVLAAGNRQHLPVVGDAERAVERLAQERFAVAHAHERFRIGAARHGPEPRAGAAGEDHGYEHRQNSSSSSAHPFKGRELRRDLVEH